MRGMDQLLAMRTFVAIVEAGSLSAGAESLESSLPAVVRRLAALEQMLGVRLLNRTTRRMTLTEEGHRYLDSSRRILAEVEAANAAVSPRAEQPAGPLRITAPVLLGQLQVAPVLTRFLERFPRVRCNLIFEDRLIDLVEHRIDVAIRVGQLQDSNLIAQEVARLQRVVVASPAYLAAAGEPQHPRDLARGNCIRFASSFETWPFKEKGRATTVAIPSNLEFNQSSAAVDACVAGLGYGMFGAPQIAHHVAEGRLKVVLQEYLADPVPVSLVYPRASLLPQRTRAFVEWMKKELPAVLSPPAAAYA